MSMSIPHKPVHSASSTTGDPEHSITVLLIDDQPIIGDAVGRMLSSEKDIRLHFCCDPTQAVRLANEVGPTVILQEPGHARCGRFDAGEISPGQSPHAGGPADRALIQGGTGRQGPGVCRRGERLPGQAAGQDRVDRPHPLPLTGLHRLLERNEAYRRLAESRKQLADEIEQAARYVASLLPEPLAEGPVRVTWRFVPSTQLGGDSFGYHWLDDDHFAMYLLDVSGHGVGASLLSVSAMNVITAQSLPNVDFRDPGQVLQALSTTFAMEKHDNKYFTIWYGVFQKSRRRLVYAGGGHPPALLIAGPSLQTRGPQSARIPGTP